MEKRRRSHPKQNGRRGVRTRRSTMEVNTEDKKAMNGRYMANTEDKKAMNGRYVANIKDKKTMNGKYILRTKK